MYFSHNIHFLGSTIVVECIITRTPITAVVRIILRRLGTTRVRRRRFTHVKYVKKSDVRTYV